MAKLRINTTEKHPEIDRKWNIPHLISLPHVGWWPNFYVGMDDQSVVDVDEECNFLFASCRLNVDSEELSRQPFVLCKLGAVRYPLVIHTLCNKNNNLCKLVILLIHTRC